MAERPNTLVREYYVLLDRPQRVAVARHCRVASVGVGRRWGMGSAFTFLYNNYLYSMERRAPLSRLPLSSEPYV